MTKIERVIEEIKQILREDTRGLTIQEISEKTKEEINGIIDESASARLRETEAKIAATEILSVLSGLEKQCITKYFFEDDSWESVGIDLGLTREKVRQIIEAAMAKMRKYLEKDIKRISSSRRSKRQS